MKDAHPPPTIRQIEFELAKAEHGLAMPYEPYEARRLARGAHSLWL